MKFALAALIASSAVAINPNPDDDYFNFCAGDWIWEDCSQLYYQSDYCTTDCGWWYSPGLDYDYSDDWWVTCDEFTTWEECDGQYTEIDWSCYSDWVWEECSGLYFQVDYCREDCGWWYSPGLDDDWSDDWWVTCDEFASWEECNGGGETWESNWCGNEWIWSDWDGAWWRDGCEGEGWTDCGWFYWDDSTDSDYWYTCDEYDEWNSQW